MKIFVGIAAYRELELLPTIDSIFGSMSGKHEVIVGVCEQDEKQQITRDVKQKYPKLKSIFHHWKNSKGAVWARKQSVSLITDEDFYLQVDGHSRLEQDWDDKFINYLEEAESKSEYKKAVISNHPVGYFKQTEESPERRLLNVLYHSELFFENDILLSRAIDASNKKEMSVAKALSAACLFSRINLIKEIPLDDNFYFYGEEMSYFLRAWTNGYDFYHIPENLVFHDYMRNELPKHWGDNTGNNNTVAWYVHNEKAIQRYKDLLSLNIQDSLYSLGNVRSLEDFEKFAKVDFKNKEVITSLTSVQTTNFSVNINWKRSDIIIAEKPKKIELYAVLSNSVQIINSFNSEHTEFYAEEVAINLKFSLIENPSAIRTVVYYDLPNNLKSIKDYPINIVAHNGSIVFAKNDCGCNKK